jgi:hypothetical protein
MQYEAPMAQYPSPLQSPEQQSPLSRQGFPADLQLAPGLMGAQASSTHCEEQHSTSLVQDALSSIHCLSAQTQSAHLRVQHSAPESQWESAWINVPTMSAQVLVRVMHCQEQQSPPSKQSSPADAQEHVSFAGSQ